MRKLWKRVGSAGLAALVATALAAGAAQAMSDPNDALRVCDPPQAHGTCAATGAEGCQQTCDAIYGPGNSVASCWSGATCCSCLFP